MGLDGRTVLVLGGGGGIGAAIAVRLAGAGAAVVVAGRTRATLESTAARIAEAGGSARALTVDATDAEAVADLVASAGAPVDVAVYAAGIAPAGDLDETDPALWDRVLRTNLTGAFHLARAAAPGMRSRGWGRLIFVASTSARVGYRGALAYTASKHGLLGLVRALATELARSGVTANAICPGYVDTPMTSATVADLVRRWKRPEAEVLGVLLRSSPQRRLIDPAEVAEVAALLASDAGGGINGQGLGVDGGAVMA